MGQVPNLVAAHFAFDARSKAVADVTLELLTTFPPSNLAPKRLVHLFARSLMEDALPDAFHYAHASRLSRTVTRMALKARGAFVRYALSPREEPLYGQQRPNIRSDPNGYTADSLGPFPKRCPVKHGTRRA
ncbi:hypothetical protein [Myxococcus xanthus]|uniref:hypothetical protein n=1 Tax=Myxococcus xanthus TaxID=34 RepID=UPI001CECA412|nr:hypothetical protein [Myxococcus xanthus]